MRLSFTDFHKFSSKLASFQIRSAPQFPQFSSKIVHFQIRSALQFHDFSSKIVNFQIRSEGCRPGRAVSGRSVADSLFRPHPEQRARASREPKNVTPYVTYVGGQRRSLRKLSAQHQPRGNLVARDPPPPPSKERRGERGGRTFTPPPGNLEKREARNQDAIRVGDDRRRPPRAGGSTTGCATRGAADGTPNCNAASTAPGRGASFYIRF